MKMKFVYKAFILSGLLLVFSCEQDAIFFKISQETVPEKPLLPGGPTNMVESYRGSKKIMYVASGNSLHWYADGAWDSGPYDIPQPGGRIRGLAATTTYLYAVCEHNGVDTELWRIGHTGGWGRITPNNKYTDLQTIYADPEGDYLFAGALSGGEYGILYVRDSDTGLKLLRSNTDMLSGAASNITNYYLSTRGKGVFKVSKADLLLTPTEDQVPQIGGNRLLMGMIKLKLDISPNNIIFVVERDGGTLYKIVESGGVSSIGSAGSATGNYATGALALWENVNNPSEKMLTAGIQGGLYSSSSTSSSSFTHGYVEFPFSSSSGSIGSRNDPPTITVDGNPDRYQASLGKHPINHMHQASPDVDGSIRRFFASTQSDGLWSYRDRTGGLQWNAEN